LFGLTPEIAGTLNSFSVAWYLSTLRTPASVGSVLRQEAPQMTGHDSNVDPKTSLAGERTELATFRTSLALLAMAGLWSVFAG
jgi:hypothetical protein